MDFRKSMLAGVAATALFTAPAMAQNAIETVDDTIGDVGNAAESAGNSIVTGANSVATGVDNAVDVDVTTDPALTTTDPIDGNLVVDDSNMMTTDPMMEDNMVTTTTSMTTREDGGKGAWGLLGLAGLLAFLFRPKKRDIHLDERHNRV